MKEQNTVKQSGNTTGNFLCAFFLQSKILSISRLDERYSLGWGATKANLNALAITAAPLDAGLRQDASGCAPANNTVHNTVAAFTMQLRLPHGDPDEDNQRTVARFVAGRRYFLL
jgi:hypothetical protein